MTKTTNYQLNQWDAADPVRREDFNADNAAVDAALKSQQTALSAHAAALDLRGNCRIWTTSYTGDGDSSSSRTITFPAKPWVVFIQGTVGSLFLCALYGFPTLYYGGQYNSLTWSGNVLTCPGVDRAGGIYRVVALIDVAE